VSLIVELLRCYEDDTIQHVEKSIDPVRDMGIDSFFSFSLLFFSPLPPKFISLLDIINTELLLADLQTVSRMHTDMQRKVL
jgi:ribosome-binding ATPase YchF (GTP1/OBG family)